MYDFITPKEKEMIMNYITYNVGNPTVPFEHLFRHWNAEKKDLFKLLDNNLIVSESIEYQESPAELTKKLYQERYSNNRFTYLIRLFNDMTNRYYQYEVRFALWHLISDHSLVSNIYDYDSIEVPTEDDKVIKLQSGMKTMKALKKLNDALHFWTEEEYEYFRNTCSQITNQKKLKGNLTISIHPLDFMTMSDNNNGWSSCMSWRDEGCYRMGTIEMMNSPMVVIAYLTNGTMGMEGCDYSWNSKKWRQLFIINPDMITSIKGYPYQNDELTKIVIDRLRKLAEKNWGITYSDQLISFNDSQSSEYKMEFDTNYMYNDFGTTTHYMSLSNNYKADGNWYCCNYSGACECMICGSDDPDDFYAGYGDETDFLSCGGCGGGYRTHCDSCDVTIYNEDDEWYLDDQCLCRDCYYEFSVVAFNDGEIHDMRNCAHYDLYDSEGNWVKDIYCYYGYWNNDSMEDYLIDQKIENGEIYIDNIIPEYLDKIKRYDCEGV